MLVFGKKTNLKFNKQISKLKSINYFEGLGSYFDKVQRMGTLISDEMLISKEKVELLTSM